MAAQNDRQHAGPRLPTVIVVHPRERRSKCSVEPLRGRDDFRFFTFPEQITVPLDGYLRLGMGGPLLRPEDAGHGLLVLDGTWRLAARMEPFHQHVPVRTLPPVLTAYPRVSKKFADPAGGLATIEAVYAALKILQCPLTGLLDEYHWKSDFLAKNGWAEADGSPDCSPDLIRKADA